MNREIEARLKISAVDKTGRVLKGVGDRLGHLNQRADQFNRSQTMIGRGMAGMLSTMARFAGPAALGYAAMYSTKEAAKFEDQLFAIQKKSGATAVQMSTLRDEIRQLGSEVPVSLDEIAAAFERGAAGGIPLDELKAFAKLTAGVADAWDTTSENTANYFMGFTASMGIARKDLAAYASLINDLADSGIADETSIADFIDRAGASLKNFGMSPEEIAAYGAALLNLKIPAEVGARAMDTLTGKLIAPENLSLKSQGALVEIVGDLNKFSKLAGNAKLQFFLKKVENLSNQKRASLLGALLGEGFDDEVMRVVAGTAEVERNLGMAQKHVLNPSNSIVEAQAKKLELFNSQLQIMQTNLKGIAIDLGDTVLPALTDIAKSINDTLSSGRAYSKGVEGMSRDEQSQQYKWFLDQFEKLYPDDWTATGRGMAAYDEAVAEVGNKKIKDVYDYIQRLKTTERYIRGEVPSSSVGPDGQPTGRTSMAIPRPGDVEFPGGGRKLDPYNLPINDVPVPGDRNAHVPSKEAARLKEQYQLYGRAQESARNPEHQFIGTVAGNLPGDYIEKFESQLSASAEGAGQKIADGGKQGAGFFDGAAQAIIDAGNAAAKAIADAVSNAQRAGNPGRAGASVGALVNADTGPSMPTSVGRPARVNGGGGF